MFDCGEMIQWSSARKMAEEYQRGMERVLGGYREVLAGLADLKRTFPDEYGFTEPIVLLDGTRVTLSEDRLDEVEHMLRQHAWRTLVKRLGVERIMSTADADKLHEALYKTKNAKELPPINADTIVSVLGGYVESAESLLMDLIKEAYECCKPVRSKYKTNSPFKVGNRVIVSGARWKEYFESWEVEYGFHRNRMRTLNNVFMLLDGRGPSTLNDGELVAAISKTGAESTGETDLFSFRLFHNGNIHLRFKREDLLERFNAIGASEKTLDKPRSK